MQHRPRDDADREEAPIGEALVRTTLRDSAIVCRGRIVLRASASTTIRSPIGARRYIQQFE